MVPTLPSGAFRVDSVRFSVGSNGMCSMHWYLSNAGKSAAPSTHGVQSILGVSDYMLSHERSVLRSSYLCDISACASAIKFVLQST